MVSQKKTVLTSLRVNVFDGKQRASGTRCAASDYSSSVTKSEILRFLYSKSWPYYFNHHCKSWHRHHRFELTTSWPHDFHMRKAVKRVERAFLTAKRPSEGGSCERSSFIPRSIPSKAKDFFESLSSARGWELFSFPPHTIDSATLTVACVACLHRARAPFVRSKFLPKRRFHRLFYPLHFKIPPANSQKYPCGNRQRSAEMTRLIIFSIYIHRWTCACFGFISILEADHNCWSMLHRILRFRLKVMRNGIHLLTPSSRASASTPLKSVWCDI